MSVGNSNHQRHFSNSFPVVSAVDGSSNISKPTIWELITQNQMNLLFLPALENLIRNGTENYYLPIHVHRNRKLIFMILMSLIQIHHLTETSSSFTEQFYGLKRIHQQSLKHVKKIRYGILLSLIELVIYPTIKLKLDDLYQTEAIALEMRQRPTTSRQRKQKWKQQVKDLFMKVYPHYRFFESFGSLLLQIAYVYGLSSFHSPWLYITKLRTVRFTMDDYKAMDASTVVRYEKLLASLGNSRFQNVLKIAWYLIIRIGSFMSTSLPAAIVLLRFHEWWSSSEHSKAKDTLPIPPPPAHLSIHPNGKAMASPVNGKPACPICRKVLVNPAMLNGYVHCYSCLFSHVQTSQMCPVTLLSANPEQIRKIYHG